MEARLFIQLVVAGFALMTVGALPQNHAVSVDGPRALAIAAGIQEFSRPNKVLKTQYQKDVRHYHLTVTEDKNTIRVEFDPGWKYADPTLLSWITADGIYETMVFDKQTLKLLRTEVVG